MPLNVAKAVFTDTRIDKAKQHIKRLRKAHNIANDEFLDDTLGYLSNITRLRNDLTHYGARKAEEGAFFVSDELWKIDGARSYFVDERDLINATADLSTISQRLAIYIVLDWAIPEMSGNAPFSWRYKPSQPIRQPSNSHPKPQK